MSRPPLPPRSSEAYLWWSIGCNDEANARDDGLSPQVKEMRQVLEALGKGYGARAFARDLAIELGKLYAPDAMRRKYRK